MASVVCLIAWLGCRGSRQRQLISGGVVVDEEEARLSGIAVRRSCSTEVEERMIRIKLQGGRRRWSGGLVAMWRKSTEVGGEGCCSQATGAVVQRWRREWLGWNCNEVVGDEAVVIVKRLVAIDVKENYGGQWRGLGRLRRVLVWIFGKDKSSVRERVRDK